MSHKPRKRFGQNFLNDHNIINNIISTIQTQPGQHWVEIGPGQGALTKPLLKQDIHLDVVELDRDLVNLLNRQFPHQDNLTIHSGDALKFDFSKLVKKDQKLHIIGNLPYNISTPLLFHLLDHANNIADMHFMLQKEVVARICAEPGNKRYGRLSVILQYYCANEYLFDVPAESFNPPPKVTSAMLKLTPYQHPPVHLNSFDNFNNVVVQAFSQRRKTLRNSLKKLFSEQQLIELSIDPSLRAESISLLEFARLSNKL